MTVVVDSTKDFIENQHPGCAVPHITAPTKQEKTLGSFPVSAHFPH